MGEIPLLWNGENYMCTSGLTAPSLRALTLHAGSPCQKEDASSYAPDITLLENAYPASKITHPHPRPPKDTAIPQPNAKASSNLHPPLPSIPPPPATWSASPVYRTPSTPTPIPPSHRPSCPALPHCKTLPAILQPLSTPSSTAMGESARSFLGGL